MAREIYLPGYKGMTDEQLLEKPAGVMVSDLVMFVCTYAAVLDNLHMGHPQLTRLMCENPHGCLLAINSNFGHAAQPGYDKHLKAPKPPPKRAVPSRSRPRKVQGDGTCFNSAVEPVIYIDHPNLSPDKVYFVKCFPTTGETQVPGSVLPDRSDGHLVLEAFVDYLNELGVGDLDITAPGGRRQIVIRQEQPNMLNYKFRLVRSSPRMLMNLQALAEYLCILERHHLAEGAVLTAEQEAEFAGWPAIVLPPFPVREVKTPKDDVKVSFRFEEASRTPRINVFQMGKINLLGADSEESARKDHAFFVRLLDANWSRLVGLLPRRDAELRAAAKKAAAAPALPPKPPLTDSEVDAILAGILGDSDSAADIPIVDGTAVNGAGPTDETTTSRGAVVDDIVAALEEWDLCLASQDVVGHQVDGDDVEDD